MKKSLASFFARGSSGNRSVSPRASTAASDSLQALERFMDHFNNGEGIPLQFGRTMGGSEAPTAIMHEGWNGGPASTGDSDVKSSRDAFTPRGFVTGEEVATDSEASDATLGTEAPDEHASAEVVSAGGEGAEGLSSSRSSVSAPPTARKRTSAEEEEISVDVREGLIPTFHQVAFPVVLRLAEASLESLERLVAYVEERWKLEHRFARERMRIRLEFRQAARLPDDSLENCLQALALYQDVESTQSYAVVEEMEQVVRAPLLKLREDLSRAVGDCRAEWRAYEREVDALERRVAKAKAVLKGKRDRRVEIREKLEYYKRLADEMRAASGSGSSVAVGGLESFLLPPSGGAGTSGFSLFGEERPDRENLEASILPRLQRQLMEVEAEIRSAAGGVELAVHQLLEGLTRLDHGHVRWTELIQRAEEERRRVLQRVSSDYLLLQLKSSQLAFAQLDRLGRMMEGVDYRADLQRFVDVHAAAGGGQATPMRSSALRLLPIGIDDLMPTRLTAHLPAPSSPPPKRDGSISSQASQGEASKSPTAATPASPERRERAPSLSRFGSQQGTHEDKPAYDDKEDAEVISVLVRQLVLSPDAPPPKPSSADASLPPQPPDSTQPPPSSSSSSARPSMPRVESFNWDHLTAATRDQDPQSLYSTSGERKRFFARIFAGASCAGRSAFLHELNQYRSRRTDVGQGFSELADVMWGLLTQCQRHSDVHNAKMAMMLSQTFWHVLTPSGALAVPSMKGEDIGQSVGGGEERSKREFLSSRLIGHPLWSDAAFWDQALWQCVLEQIPTIELSHGGPWHDLTGEARDDVVRRVQNIIFSQAGTLGYSMLEFGVGIPEAADFICRVAERHQLSEEMKFTLLRHLFIHAKQTKRREEAARAMATWKAPAAKSLQERLLRANWELENDQEYKRQLEEAPVSSEVNIEALRAQHQSDQYEPPGSTPSGEPSHHALSRGTRYSRSPSFFFRVKLEEEAERAGAAHACEVRFEGLSYSVERVASRAAAVTVGAQCLRLWTLPFAWLLPKAQQQQKVRLQVLQDVTGVLRPGRLTLLLGPPGSGKSTFLKALSGRLRRGRGCVVQGKITYNGDTADSKRFSLPKVVAYVAQEDQHAPTLSVQETVRFAFDCMAPANDGSLDATLAPPMGHVTPRHHGSVDAPPFSSPLHTPPHSRPSSSAATGGFSFQHKHTGAEGMEEGGEALDGSADGTSTTGSWPSTPLPSPAAHGGRAADRVEQTLRVLGLTRCRNTVVGNALLRGISGGEKKRLTTAEMTGGHINVLLLDSISTGLDSAATFDIVTTLHACTRSMHANIVACLLQPPPEVFELFDDVMVMDQGQVVYHGPRQAVLQHFESMGLRCPPRKDVADFLVEVTTPAGREYALPPCELSSLGLPPVPTTTQHFVQRFRASGLWADTKQHFEREPLSVAWLGRQQREFSNSWARSTWLCVTRQFTITRRDRVFLRGRILQVLVMGVMCGTLFYQLEATDWSDKVCLLFFSLMFTALGNMATIPIVYEQRNVFYKQRDSGFFPTSSAVVAQMLVQCPLQLSEALIFSALAYFLSGLCPAAHGYYYAVFLIVVLSSALAIGQFFRLIVHIVPGLPQAQPLSALGVLLFVVFSGLTIRGEDMPGYWLWLYWINPLAWGLRALAINEFTSPNEEYAKLVPYPPPSPHGGPKPTGKLPLGDVYLLQLGFQTSRDWIWYGVAYLLGLWLVLLLLTTAAMHFIRWAGVSIVPLAPGHKHGKKEEEEGEEDGQASKFKGEHTQAADAAGGRSGDVALRDQSGMTFKPVTLLFRDMWYSVDVPTTTRRGRCERVELLKGVSGYAKPGTLTALMGSSGAGKTTLMDVLAGRKTTGSVCGQMLVNGHVKHAKTFARVVGYVEQLDVHSPHSTVREALDFSAILRLPYAQVSESQRRAFVDDVMGMLELDSVGHRLIGEDADSGLSMGERKRVTIGVELVANPSVLFLDEPTTGLDARSALVVMRSVKKIARAGRSVICTIHQPSAAIFDMFDNLLLLRHGGRTVFFGPVSQLIPYFEAVPGVRPIQPGINAANWMLECIGAGISPATQSVDFAEWYLQSPLGKHNAKELQELTTQGVRSSTELRITFKSRYAAPLYVQLKACMEKAGKNYWRSPNYNFSRMLICALVALIFGSVFHHKAYDSEQAVLGRIGLIYLSTSFVGIVNMMSVMPVMAKERAVFYREQASSSYSVFAYAVSYGLVELPYIFITTGLFVNVFYWFVGMAMAPPISKFVFYWVFFGLYITCTVFIGQFLICLLPNQQTAQVAGAAVAAMMNLFAGYLCTPKNIKPFWKFVFYLVPTHYTLEGLVMTQFENDKTPIQPVYGSKPIPADRYVYEHFGGEFTYDHVWYDIGILIAYILALRIGTFLTLSFVRHINR